MQRGQRILISASDANERSWESDFYRAGYFTHYLLEGFLKYGSTQSAYGYAKPLVKEAVFSEKRTKDGKRASQTPQAVFLPTDADMLL